MTTKKEPVVLNIILINSKYALCVDDFIVRTYSRRGLNRARDDAQMLAYLLDKMNIDFTVNTPPEAYE